MAKADSLDLRQKGFGAWQNGEGSQAQSVRRFDVSVSFVRDLSRRFRTSGSVAAKAHGGGRVPGADAAVCRAVVELVAAPHDPPPRRAPSGFGRRRAPFEPLGARARAVPARIDTKKRRSATTERATERGKTLRQSFAEAMAGAREEDLGVRGRERGQPRQDTHLCAQPAGYTRLWQRPAQLGRPT